MSTYSSKIKRAVVVSLVKEGEDFRWRLDDGVKKSSAPITWEYDVHCTSDIMLNSKFENLDWSEKELADFGYSILARLNAFRKLDEI
jgi:hypothetical protein